MTTSILTILLVPISLIALRYRARCAELQRTIATLVRERDDVIARSVGNEVMRSRKAGQQ